MDTKVHLVLLVFYQGKSYGSIAHFRTHDNETIVCTLGNLCNEDLENMKQQWHFVEFELGAEGSVVEYLALRAIPVNQKAFNFI